MYILPIIKLIAGFGNWAQTKDASNFMVGLAIIGVLGWTLVKLFSSDPKKREKAAAAIAAVPAAVLTNTALWPIFKALF